jgi:peptide/nickel transport system permease protein
MTESGDVAGKKMKKMKKQRTISVIIGILVLLLFLPFSPSAASSQLGFVVFLAALGALIIGLWILAPTLAPIWKPAGRLLKHPFARFVVKKVVFYLIVAFIALNIVFFIPRLMPGNPVDQMIPPGIPQAGMIRIRESLTEYFGFDRPLHEQYISFWANLLLRGDMGTVTLERFRYHPVAAVVMSKLPYTLVLVVPVLLISFFVGNWIGARAAYMKGKRGEAVYFTSVFASQLPFYWFGIVLLYLLAFKAGIFPMGGTFTPGRIPGMNLETFIDALRHYALPFLTLLIITTGGWATGMRAMTLYELDSGYILYAKQLGFRGKRLMSYAKRNAILPQFTGLNINLNNLIGMTMIIEIVFGWKGLGLLAFDAIFARDYMTMLGTFMVTMIVVIVGNFLVDLAYAFIDPRIRAGQGG